MIGRGESVELLPRSAHILLLQADLAKQYQLHAEVVGVQPEARLCVFPLYSTTFEKQDDEEEAAVGGAADLEEFLYSNGGTNGSPPCVVERLPLLPDYP